MATGENNSTDLKFKAFMYLSVTCVCKLCIQCTLYIDDDQI